MGAIKVMGIWIVTDKGKRRKRKSTCRQAIGLRRAERAKEETEAEGPKSYRRTELGDDLYSKTETQGG